jgi:hypothetical protein
MTVFVFAPAQHYTGGITALYQLCRNLNNYIDTKIVFIDTFSDEKIENYIHQNYLHFGCAHISQSKVHDSKDHIIVIPEARPELIAKYKFSKKILYWLSVDNFLMSISPISRSIIVKLLNNLLLRGRFDLVWFAGLSKFKQYLKHDHTYRRILGNAVKGEYYSSFARDKKVQIPPADIHLLQSCYVYYFLTNFIEKSKMFFIHEPLEDDYLNFSVSKDRKEDIVTWNTRKAYPITLKIIKALKKNKVRVIALENVGKSNMINILGKSKIFIDIGHHPGRDRPPREAVALGNIVIVNNHGGCFYYDDCMIEPPFKVDCYTESRCNIDPKKVAEDILHYMENYEYYYKKYFAKFREYTLEEPKLYQKEIEKLAKILSDIIK